MKKEYFLGFLLFAVGFGSGYFLQDRKNFKEGMETHGQSMEHGMPEMMHSQLEVDAAKPIPTISLEVLKDSKDGYNLHILTENFKFSPENVNGEPLPNEGHVHVLINGVKLDRFYAPWVHVGADKLKDGQNVIEVTLNANNHAEWVYQGQHLEAKATVVK